MKTLHPEWGEDEVNTEVQRIRQDQGMNLVDPFMGAPDSDPHTDE